MTTDSLKEYSPEWWAAEITRADKWMKDRWKTSAHTVVRRFLAEDDEDDTQGKNRYAGFFNLFWVNTSILKSALYATTPKPVVKRQHDDSKDTLGRTAALVLQRILSMELEKQNSSTHGAFSQATEDRLLSGLGQVWVRLESDIEEVPATLEAPAHKVIKDQRVITDYVNWDDFIYPAIRVWSEVPWVCRRVWLSPGAAKKRFTTKYEEVKEKAKDLKDRNLPDGFVNGRMELYEVWCKETRKMYTIHLQSKSELEPARDDPLGLEDFLPCPPPLLATHSTREFLPRPDYVMVQKQYSQLDNLSARIDKLTDALKMVGFFDSSNKELKNLFSGRELTMIPVENWAELSEKGGTAKAVEWYPIEQVQKVLTALVEQREMLVQQVYELTGISDIMRGGSNPRETLGAQKLKAQYSSVRLRLTQQDVANFVCATLRLRCEIISKHVDPEIIRRMSLADEMESAELFDHAIPIIKSWPSLSLRVEVSEESLSMADYTAEREMRIAFLTAIGQFLSQAGQMAVAYPAALPYLMKMISWVAASFRGADDMQTVMDDAFKAAQSAPPTPPDGGKPAAPPPPPEQVESARAQREMAVGKQTADLNLRNKLVENLLNEPKTPGGIDV
jgi:hypothetical protein